MREFSSRFRDLHHKNRDFGSRVSQASHINTMKFYEGKSAGKNSETEPARLTGLI